MKTLSCAVGLLIAAAAAWAQTAPVSDEIRSLRQELSAQRLVIQQQSREIDELKQAVKQLAVESHAGGVPASAMSTPAAASTSATSEGRSAQITTDTRSAAEEKASPLTVRIGGMEFDPGGFLDLTSSFRSTNVGSGIGTSFGTIPFPNTAAGHLTELRLSAQNSRLSLKITGTRANTQLTGYVETDFGGVQPNNVFVTTNSTTLRMRLFWADVYHGKWEVMGGQSWSWLNPNRSGVSPMPADIFFTQNMDTNYQVGLTWTRAPQFRVVYHASPRWAMGVALEGPEQYIGSNVALPASVSSAYASQLNTGSLSNTPNLHPDIIPKVAWDKDVDGRHLHLEAVGLLRSFKVFNPSSGVSSVETGGGGSVNANLEVLRNFRIIMNTFYSDGGGRYIFGLGPDVVVRPGGTLSLVHSGSGIGGLEYQIHSTLLSAYYGGTYFQKNFFLDPTTKTYVGYGFPGSPSNRMLEEATVGMTQTIWKNKNYGALQLLLQYSFLKRSLWSPAAGQPADAHTHLWYTDLRYILP